MKRIAIGIMAIVFIVVAWYLYIKAYDYQVSFKVNAVPASIYHEVKALTSWGGTKRDENVTLINTQEFESVVQNIQREDQNFVLDWKFEKINDTSTKVIIGIISKEHSMRNRLQVLIGSSSLINTVKSEMITFAKTFKDFTKKFKVEINGQVASPEMEYVYISLTSKRLEKAIKMIVHNDSLYPRLIKNKLQKKGYPLVKINSWDAKTDNIDFDFGFPIQHRDSLQQLVGLKYKKITSKKSLKATYYGNYKDSDQAWLSLLEYAKSNNIDVERFPLEIFYNNPMHGGNELDWKAEIFLPLK